MNAKKNELEHMVDRSLFYTFASSAKVKCTLYVMQDMILT